MTRDADDRGAGSTAIAELVERHAALWSTLDMEGLIDLWDADDPEVVYVAHELGDILVGMPEIAVHLLRTGGRLSSAHVSIPGQWSRQLSDDIAVTVFICRWQFVRAESGTAAVAHSRVTALCRRVANGWRFAHYMEDSYYIPEQRSEPGWGAFPAAPAAPGSVGSV